MTFKHDKPHLIHRHSDKKSKSRNISLGFGLLLFLGLFLPFFILFVFPFITKENAVKGPPLHAHIQLMEQERAQKKPLEKSE